MTGQMCWLSKYGSDGEKMLHLRLNANDKWTPYTAMPQYSVPDYRDFANGSKGWATFQKLIKAGWKVLPSHGNSTSDRQTSYIPDRVAI